MAIATIVKATTVSYGRQQLVDEADNLLKAMLTGHLDSHESLMMATESILLSEDLKYHEFLTHIVEIFKLLITAEDSDTFVDKLEIVRKAEIRGKLIRESVLHNHPANNLASRIQLVVLIISGDMNGLNGWLNSNRMRGAYPLSDDGLIALLEKIKAKPINPLVQGLYWNDIDYDRNDIFQRVVIGALQASSNEFLRSSPMSSDGVLFVEGPTDLAVFNMLFKKMKPDINLLVIDTENWSNMKYYAQTKYLKKLSFRTYFLTDGDKYNNKLRRLKDRMIKSLGLPGDVFIVLKKNSVEDYLLNANAIKSAFPSMTDSVLIFL